MKEIIRLIWHYLTDPEGKNKQRKLPNYIVVMRKISVEEIQKELKAAGHYDGDIDGDFGPKSRRGAQAFLRALCPNNPWPKRAKVREFYGEPGEGNLVEFEFPYPMFYGGKKVTKSRCHKKVKASLLRVLESIKPFLSDPDVAEEAQDYAGIYNYRPKRGSTSLSMHAWGIAIDLDADDNSFKLAWPIAADMHWEIIKAFAREGWTSAAVWWGYDAMHFEAVAP